MTDPVLAPEQQGDRKAWIRRELDDASALMQTIPPWLKAPSQLEEPVEQQGEPVCQRCGEAWSHLHDMTRTLCCGGHGHHPFEPAPPPSEEAEAQWERMEESPDGGAEGVV